MILNDVKIKKITIGGINNPTFSVIGSKNKLYTLKIKVNGKYYELSDDIRNGREYVENLLNKDIKIVNFHNIISIPSKTKKVDLYVQFNGVEELICTKNTNLFLRVLHRLYYTFILIYAKIKIFFIKTCRFFKRVFQFRNLLNKKNNIEGIRLNYFDPLYECDYRKWLRKCNSRIEYKKLKYNPLISVIVPVYNVDEKYLRECIESVLSQSYTNYELILVDDCSTNKKTINTLKIYQNNPNIKVIYRKKNGHISEATNTGIENASGEYISLLDNDDTLDKDALYFVVLALNSNKKIDMIYSDEDKLNGENYCFPHFKPDYSPDTLYTVNYICHFTTLRTSIVKKIGGFRSGYNGAQDYDLFLRFTEQTKNIYHIPRVLYHWRMIESSTASNGNNKDYAYVAGKKAIEDSLMRRKINANVNLLTNVGMYDVQYLYNKEPKISIIIPTKDRSDLVDKCLKSIYEKTNYKNYEIIVINNNSIEEKTFKLLNTYKKNKKNFNYYDLNCEFNYSYINNEAVKKASGDFIVLLNNDIEIISNNWLAKMVGYASQKHIGCVGVKLLYPNNTVQHCGVILGCGGIASHAFLNSNKEEYGYFSRLVGTYDYSAVTAACLMIEKKKYNQVGGLDENLKVAYNDVDLNMKTLKEGYYNVCIPTVMAYHHESVSRGNDFDEKNKSRFISEMKYMINKWGEKILYDDFYNKNLSIYYPFYLDKNRSIIYENKK